MFSSKFNRKFKKVLSISTFCTVCCTQNVIVADDKFSDLFLKLSSIERKNLCDCIKLWSKAENYDLQTYDGERKCDCNLIHKCDDVLEKLYIYHVSYKDNKITSPVNVIILNDEKSGNVYMLPHTNKLPELLKVVYRALDGTDWDLSKYERKCWEKTDEFENYLVKEKSRIEKEKKDIEEKYKDDTVIDDIARYLGWTRGQVITAILVGAIVIVGGAVYIINKTLLNAGTAIGTAIHGVPLQQSTR